MNDPYDPDPRSDSANPSDSARPAPSAAPNTHPGSTPGSAVPIPLTQKSSGLAIAALVVGIPGLCFAPLGIAALIMGIVALTQIGDPRRALTGRGMAITGTVLGGLSLVFVPFVLIGIMLPALGAARRTARKMANTTQVRGIQQAMISYGSSNGSFYPGLDSKGRPVDLTVEERFFVLLDQNSFSGSYLISPAESDPAKHDWLSGQVTQDHYSYAMLDVSDPGSRRREWQQTLSSLAITLSDRNTDTSGVPTHAQSIHSPFPGQWQGAVARNDGSATIEHTHILSTKYRSSPGHTNDDIFEMAGNDDAAMIHSGE